MNAEEVTNPYAVPPVEAVASPGDSPSVDLSPLTRFAHEIGQRLGATWGIICEPDTQAAFVAFARATYAAAKTAKAEELAEVAFKAAYMAVFTVRNVLADLQTTEA